MRILGCQGVMQETVKMARGTQRSGEAGQGLAEYALILTLLAIVAISALLFLGGGIDTILSTINKSR